MKGLTNRIIASFLFIITLPVMIVVTLIIMFFDKGRVFFIQERIGRGKKPFKIYKFKTMLGGKVTKIGWFLRRSGIDEIPQLLNIIKGDMNFSGPRPLTLADIERLGWNDDFHKSRWDIKPGLSGLAQLSPVCNKKVSWFYDIYYIKNRSFLMDMKLHVASLSVLVLGKRRVQNFIRKR